jgi:hypothetical protein
MQRKPKIFAGAMVAAMALASACGGATDAASPSPTTTSDAFSNSSNAAATGTGATSGVVSSTTAAPAATATAIPGTTSAPSTAPAASVVPPSPTAPPNTTAPGTTAPGTKAPASTAPPPTSPPTSTSHFSTLPVGAALPSDSACAAAVRRSPEVRAANAAPNSTKGVGANSTYPRVTGNFTGTTDEILQWAACKWGIDEDVVRAQIAKESWWRMSTVGDNGDSFGLGQVRITFHASAFVNNNAKASSAYNLDYTYAVWRDCYEGHLTWLNTAERTGTYAAGDAAGCLGVWYSGRWHTADANTYIEAIVAYVNQRVWETVGFKNG